MARLLGIDLGTSSVKVVVIDGRARLLGVGSQEYRIIVARPGWAEQDPEEWWQATQVAVRQALSEAGTEATDASATALFDVRQRQWSSTIIEILDLPDNIWPNVFEASDIVGALTRSAAQALGLPTGIPVAAGCADQPAQAVGNGLIDP